MGLDMSWIGAMVFVIFAVVLMWTGQAYLKENGHWATDVGAAQAKARLKSKRKGWRKSSMASQPVEQQYFATFELEDGSSLELYVLEEKKYFWLTEGEQGTLFYDGKIFVDFNTTYRGVSGLMREVKEEHEKEKLRRDRGLS